MKKLFLSALVCLASTVAISCGSKAEKEKAKTVTVGTEEVTFPTVEKIDTLSYIVGMDIANSIERNMLPTFKVDYNIMMNALQQALDPEATLTIEGESFNKENFRQVGDRYFTNEFRGRIMAAMNDSTGSVQIYKDDREKNIVSAILGADIAYNAMNVKFNIDKATLLSAISDIHNGKGKITDEYAMEYTRNYFTVVIPQQNKKESEQWLAGLENKDGIQKTASGILYKIEKAGDSNVKATKDEDVVKVLYTGRTRDGKVFDSNRWDDMPQQRQEMVKLYQPDQANKDNPIEFPLNRVIKGWTEGMKLIGKGGRIILWIPAELAYGEQGSGQDIGPNEALCFDVELLDVQSK